MANEDRIVAKDQEILAIPCPTCKARVGQLCRMPSGAPLAFVIGDDQSRFHRDRIMNVLIVRLRNEFGRLNASDKALICYYAFVILSDSVSTKSKEMLGHDYSSKQIQQFFVQKAIEELKKDRLL